MKKTRKNFIGIMLSLGMITALSIGIGAIEVQAGNKEIKPIVVSIDWEGLKGFKAGEPLPEITDNEIRIRHEGIVEYGPESNIPLEWGRGWLEIRVTREHLEKGYINQEDYDDAVQYYSGWLEADKFSDDYRISLTDIYGWKRVAMPRDGYYFVSAPGSVLETSVDISENVLVYAENVRLRAAHTYPYGGRPLNNQARIYLDLGIGYDLIERINRQYPLGWREDAIGFWYQEADGTYPYSTWKYIDGYWYYFNAAGYCVHGWQKISGTWYYFNEVSGKMYADMRTHIDGVEYCFDKSGAMVIGWYKDSYEQEGVIYYNWYYAGSDGSLVEGWQKIGGTWYYFDPVAGWMWRDIILTIGGKDYLFDESGAMVTGWYKTEYGSWYYFTDYGMTKGWKQIDGIWYYFHENDGEMYAEVLTKIDGGEYYFDQSGAMVTGWQLIEGDWYYFGASGAGYTGWVQSGSSWYYTEKGLMYNDGVYYIEAENKYAQFDASGVWVQYVS